MSRLLIVEDEAHIASGLRYNLEADGHEVTVKDNGEGALLTLAANQAGFDLVVLDVMLPGIDGFTVAARMRAKGWLTPILMLTARGRAEDVLRGFEAGADDYLPKPFELSILLARVNALLRRHAWHAVAREANAATQTPAPDVFKFADKTVDFDAQELQVCSTRARRCRGRACWKMCGTCGKTPTHGRSITSSHGCGNTSRKRPHAHAISSPSAASAINSSRRRNDKSRRLGD
jgi:DNA-binding response OmpR family regulator